jgi:hypothetical protein
MTYRIVYDIAHDPPFDIHAGLLALGFVSVGIVWRSIQRAKDRKLLDPPSRKGMTTPKVLIVFGGIIAVLGIGLMGWDHWRLQKAVLDSDVGVVEGPIQSWGTERIRTARRDKYEYNLYERFYVGDSIWFDYYRDVGQAGFHNAQEPLVEFKDGMMVRATYLYADGMDDPPRIVKLEVSDDTNHSKR